MIFPQQKIAGKSSGALPEMLGNSLLTDDFLLIRSVVSRAFVEAVKEEIAPYARISLSPASRSIQRMRGVITVSRGCRVLSRNPVLLGIAGQALSVAGHRVGVHEGEFFRIPAGWPGKRRRSVAARPAKAPQGASPLNVIWPLDAVFGRCESAGAGESAAVVIGPGDVLIVRGPCRFAAGENPSAAPRSGISLAYGVRDAEDRAGPPGALSHRPRAGSPYFH